MRNVRTVKSLALHDIGLLPDHFFEWRDFHRHVEDKACL